MGERIHALAQNLNGKDNLDEWSIDELRHIVKRHPYFAPAQFLLLQKLRQSGTPEEADAQYRKAVLYYHDPLMFEQFISANQFYTNEWQELEDAKEKIANEISKDTLFEETKISDPAVFADPIEEVHVETNETIEEIGDTSFVSTEQPMTENSTQVETPFTQDSETVLETDSLNDSAMSMPVANVEEQPVVLKENSVVENPVHAAAEPVANGAQHQDLAFEPFHTVDYFASQGIKISQEELPKDKLAKQLKSFTEWLKTMKRLPAAQVTQNVESSAEKKVEALADHSVSESDVVTEAMAEVWLKQGNTEKALDIYNKLSLLNPSKKAYFAAKIENLKQS